MNIKDKMNENFRGIEGGLFSDVEKADVGDAVAKLAADGISVMAWADPFFPDPSMSEQVKAVLLAAVESGLPTHYTAPVGNFELKTEIAKKLKNYNGLTVDPARNIIITPGSDSGLLFAMMPFINPRDEVLVPDPSYPSNFLNPKLLGGVAVPVPIHSEDNYQPDVREFAKKLTPKTKMVLISHPNNPTTTVFRRERLEKLCDFIIENDLILVCDQAFEDMVYDGIEMVTPASLPGMWERTVTVFSVSKGMGLSGFRVGYVVADDKVMDVMFGCAVNVIGATNTAAQIGAVAAFQNNDFLDAFREKLDKRRHMVFDVFKDIPGVKLTLPESGFLTWLDVSALGSSADIVAHILKEAKVLVNDGANYGLNGRGHIRIVTGCFWEDADVLEACRRIRAALEMYGNKL